MAQPSLSFDPIDEARRHWEERWTEDAATEMVAVTSIMRVHQILIARLNEVREPFGLPFPRYEALMLLFLSRRGSLPLGKIGERLQVHRTSVTNTVDGLEKLGVGRGVPPEADPPAGPASPTPSTGWRSWGWCGASRTSPTAAPSSPRSPRPAARSPRRPPRPS